MICFALPLWSKTLLIPPLNSYTETSKVKKQLFIIIVNERIYTEQYNSVKIYYIFNIKTLKIMPNLILLFNCINFSLKRENNLLVDQRLKSKKKKKSVKVLEGNTGGFNNF